MANRITVSLTADHKQAMLWAIEKALDDQSNWVLTIHPAQPFDEQWIELFQTKALILADVAAVCRLLGEEKYAADVEAVAAEMQRRADEKP